MESPLGNKKIKLGRIIPISLKMSKFHHESLLHLILFHLSNILFLDELNLGTKFFQRGEICNSPISPHGQSARAAQTISPLHVVRVTRAEFPHHVAPAARLVKSCVPTLASTPGCLSLPPIHSLTHSLFYPRNHGGAPKVIQPRKPLTSPELSWRTVGARRRRAAPPLLHLLPQSWS
jgi:hypothetical protein